MKPPFAQTKSWKVDHSYDDQNYKNSVSTVDDDISTIYGGSQPGAYSDDPLALYETPEEKKLRKRSHIVAYLTMFIMTIGFSIVISGVWPYLYALEPTRDKTSMGWVIAANPLGQFIASPIVGYLGNRFGSIRRVCYGTVSLYILGNLLYSFLPALGDLWTGSAFHMMLLARFITGLSSSNVTLCRSYLAASTTVKERTTGISIISAAQSLGFVLGPAIQAILTAAIPSDGPLQYRACGWVGAILGCVNLVLLTPFIFKEYNIAEKERALLKERSGDKEEYKLPVPDYYAVGGILFGFFINQFVYVLLESLLEPFVADQFAWCSDKAVIIVGVTLSLAGILAIPMFITATRLAKKFDERKILMFGAFVPISIGLFLMLPWGSSTLQVCYAKSNCTGYITTEMPTTTAAYAVEDYIILNKDNLNPIMIPHMGNKFEHNEFAAPDVTLSTPYYNYNWADDRECCSDNVCPGCPQYQQSWCDGYTQISKAQFFIAFFIVCGGYPYGVSMSNAIFSKILGPKPQGTWMGFLTSSGAFARITGPIFVSYTYTNLGSRWLFSILIVMMFLALSEITILFRRLVPMKLPDLTSKSKKQKTSEF